ncbi:predicted protein [Histoplasma capsulatum H143]|uniref:Uncharacterized protein n=1 Tax=Ajellomyces capsulatus (strain H143) TaxID=544712 RepID=C6HDS9_AJECH|nr:predicted protein [Histoplasma capsulatum H143]
MDKRRESRTPKKIKTRNKDEEGEHTQERTHEDRKGWMRREKRRERRGEREVSRSAGWGAAKMKGELAPLGVSLRILSGFSGFSGFPRCGEGRDLSGLAGGLLCDSTSPWKRDSSNEEGLRSGGGDQLSMALLCAHLPVPKTPKTQRDSNKLQGLHLEGSSKPTACC